jgi:parallel beta-helix repeat protein
MKTALCKAVLLAIPMALAGSAAALAGDGDIECGATVAEDRVLTHDLVGCPATGVVVTGDATLDINGHRVTGAQGSSVGVSLGEDATVRDGTVSGFRNGVVTDGGTVTGMRVTGNVRGVALTDGSAHGATVESSFIAGNGSGVDGGAARGYSILGNRIRDNLGDGIRAGSSNDNAVYADNRVERNGGYGLFVKNSTSRITGNRASRNGADGIYVEEDFAGFYAFYFLADNVANANDQLGIRVQPNLSGELPVDGGGNVAKHNGDPRQCLNIACSPNQGASQQQ